MSLERVKNAAWFSSLAHLDAKSIGKRLPERGYELIKFITIGSVECYIAFNKKNQRDQVLAFRETEDAKSWMLNFDFLPTETPYGVLHNGFYDILMDGRKEIMSYIDDKKFVALGFSQGASLSRMFSHIITKREVLSRYKPFFVAFEPAMESKTNDYNPYGIYTFKGNDPVCMIPLKLTGWNQSGECFYITGNSEKIFINPKKLKKALMVASDTIMDSEDGFTKEDILRDHNISNIKNIWETPKNEDKILQFAKEKFNFK